MAAPAKPAPSGMEELISVINDLQTAFSRLQINEKDMNLDLPRIAVVGSQSSGKSSVLESFVGKDFLPRGSGIVTRCPLVLQLVHAPPGAEEFAVFGHRPDKFTDFKAVSAEITRRTNELAGSAVVCESPIMLKVTSPNVLTLTLIDLPGLVHNATRGQPDSIVQAIHNMVRSFISPENTIVLAITSAAEDIANSRSLDMARQVDREGKRTIGVLTKLDLMDEGTDALPVLNNELIRLKHGFIGVVNRSQRDLNEQLTVDMARKKEREFFLNHPSYSSIAHRCGSQYLASVLNAMLLTHIQQCIPGLKAHVDQLLEGTRKKMEQLGMNEPQMDHSAKLLTLLHKYDETIKNNLGGDIDEIARGEVMGGARVKAIFSENFGPFILSMRASSTMNDEDIRTRIRSASGFQGSFYPPEKVIWTLAKLQIKRFEEPCRQCLGYVHEELQRIVERSADFMNRFPQLKVKVTEVTSDLLKDLRQPCNSHIATMILAEQAFINVDHPIMIEARRMGFNRGGEDQQQPHASGAAPAQQGGKGYAPPQQQPQPRPSPPPVARGPGDTFSMPTNFHLANEITQPEKQQIDNIRDLVEVYFSIVKGNIVDQVPKVIVLLMLQRLKETLIHKLMKDIYRDGGDAEALLSESADLASQRRAVTQMLKSLTVAQEVLARVRDHHLRISNN